MKKKDNKTIEQLRRFESRNVTFIEPNGSWPIVWERANGMRVWDDAGREYLDFTAAFAVAAAGHANPRIVAAGQRQMARLLHAMGDVHPHALKADLARELSRITFQRLAKRTGKTIFCSSGFEAVEAALKTAHLATGRTRVIAFEDAYHGLGYGALNATWRSDFRSPFPPPGFLKLLRNVCNKHGALLICDEVYTGFGRTGRWFASEHFGVAPDVFCLGKALTGGFPLSACVGRADVMDRAWPESTGEAIHTSTFLGHPVGCAMAMASLREIKSRKLTERSAEMGRLFLEELRCLAKRLGRERCRARGVGLMLALELFHGDGTPAADIALGVIRRLLRDGFILLPEGDPANILSFTPPLTVGKSHITKLIRALGRALEEAFA